MSAENGWIRVGSLEDVPPGESRAVKISEGRSVALFNVDGRIHATDNQCPHMGFPLTRGVVKDGVLTCDWHGRSFDLEGGVASTTNATTWRPSRSTSAATNCGFRPETRPTGAETSTCSCSWRAS